MKIASAKDRQQAAKTIQKIALGYLATSSNTGRPHSAAMLVVADKDFNIYFISRRKTQKSRNLASNPQASISLGEAPPFTFQFFGRVKEITDAKLRSAITKKWTEQAATLNDVWPPILRQTGGEFAYYVLKPSRVTALDLRHQNIEGGDSLYVKII